MTAAGRRIRGWDLGSGTEPRAGQAAPRDASWFDHPGRGGRYHIIHDDGGGQCGVPMLILELARPADRVDVVLRCHRNGCRKMWP